MKSRKTLLLAAVWTALTAIVLSLMAISSASGDTAAPPFEPDPNAQGSISFFDSSGAQVTSGTSLTHLFDYALASTAGRAGTNKASLTFAFPDHTKTDPLQWFASTASGPSTYPNSTAPGTLATATTPLVSLGATDGNLSAVLPTTTLDTTTGYAGIIQIRLKDSGPGKQTQTTPYWETDISIDTSTPAGSWTQVFQPPDVVSTSPPPSSDTPTTGSSSDTGTGTAPAGGVTATTTTIAESPTGPQPAGASITLTATVTPVAPGTVQFMDGTAPIGDAVDASSGTATLSIATLGAGSHSLAADFNPTDSTAFGPSMSTPDTFVITGSDTSSSSTPTDSSDPSSTDPTTSDPAEVLGGATLSPGGGALAHTGADVLRVVALGVALAAAGGLVLMFAVRRRRGAYLAGYRRW